MRQVCGPKGRRPLGQGSQRRRSDPDDRPVAIKEAIETTASAAPRAPGRAFVSVIFLQHYGLMASTVSGRGHHRHRSSYHHGDLPNALTDAATEMARQGGPDAVVLRAVAPATGVSAAAAYPHFTAHGELTPSGPAPGLQ